MPILQTQTLFISAGHSDSDPSAELGLSEADMDNLFLAAQEIDA